MVPPFSPLSLLEPQSPWSQFSPAHYIVIVTTLPRIDCDRNMWTWTSLCLYLICLFVKRITIRVSKIEQDRQDDGSLRPRFCCLTSTRTEDLTSCLVLHENLEFKIKRCHQSVGQKEPSTSTEKLYCGWNINFKNSYSCLSWCWFIDTLSLKKMLLEATSEGFILWRTREKEGDQLRIISHNLLLFSGRCWWNMIYPETFSLKRNHKLLQQRQNSWGLFSECSLAAL